MNDINALPQMLNNSFELFANQIAMVDLVNNKQYTYKELKYLAQKLAYKLIMAGNSTDDVIPILLKDKCHQVISIIGCWFAGVAYCPIETNTPKERIKFIINDISPKAIILDDDISLEKSPRKILIKDILSPLTITGENYGQNFASFDSLAYVIYTSGSTGKPKGVMIEHRSIANLISSMGEIKQLEAHEYMIQNCSYAFDPSLWTIFWPLLFGAILVCPSDEQIKSPKVFCNILSQFKVQTIHAGPAYSRLLLSEPSFAECYSLKIIIGGGEAWTFSLYDNLLKTHPNINLYNVYGPTEACVHVTTWKFCKEIHDKKNVPIGKPIKNVEISILDENGLIVEQSPGEIAISGISLARGYLNNEKLTKEKFVTVLNKYDQPLKLYKTGDYGAMNENGELLYFGRIDRQVKISGYRIELDEIEFNIKSQMIIKDCAVIVVSECHALKIIAFIVFNEIGITEAHIKYLSFKESLEKHLPRYMLPSHYLIQESIPLNDRMKVDNKALEQIFEKYKQENVGPESSTNLSLQLKSLWQSAINVTQVHEQDNFFETGGDSLRALKLLSMLNHKFNSNFQLSIMFENQTFQALKIFLEQNVRMKNHQNHIFNKNAMPDYWPVSKNQLRLINAATTSRIINNAVRIYQLNFAVSESKLKKTIFNVLNEHELLQANIIKIENNYYLTFKYNREIFNYTDLSKQQNQTRLIQDIQNSYLYKEVNLATDSLFLTHLIKIETKKYILFIYLNHVIMDTESSNIVVKSIFKNYFYQNNLREKLYLKYFNYVEEQSMAYKESYHTDITYWTEKLAFKDRYIIFNTATYSNIDDDNESISLLHMLNENLVSIIQIYLLREKITAFQFFITVFQLTLHQLTKQPQFAIGYTISKRNKNEYNNVVGPMSTKAIIMFNNEKTECFNNYLHKNCKHINQNLRYMNLDYEDIRKKINEIEFSDHDLFNVMFDYAAHTQIIDVDINQLILELDMHNINKIKRHLSFKIIDKNNNMEVCIRARRSIGNEFISQFLTIFLENITKACDCTVSNFGIRTI
jgi:amino acid adenylation domain-containing protein